jgi:glycerol-3-phosphate acyltransferase PlsY
VFSAVGVSDILWFAAGYLSGSVPFGLLLTRLAGLGDVRRIGSGNIGATNVLRTGSKKLAAATLLLDMLKGLLPVAAAHLLAGLPAAMMAGAGAFAGHVLPVWLRFRGGKGVATYIGVLLGLWWPLGLAFVVIWLAMAVLYRISSLSALTAASLMPLTATLAGREELVNYLFILGVAIFITHRDNLRRLIRGEEPRINIGRK